MWSIWGTNAMAPTWDGRTTCGELACYATALALINNIFKETDTGMNILADWVKPCLDNPHPLSQYQCAAQFLHLGSSFPSAHRGRQQGMGRWLSHPCSTQVGDAERAPGDRLQPGPALDAAAILRLNLQIRSLPFCLLGKHTLEERDRTD